MPRRLDADRRAELLNRLMLLIAERGFSKVSTSEIARMLGCSVATLYKLASSKEDLVLAAIARWAQVVFDDMELRSAVSATASQRARAYFLAGAEKLHPMSLAFYADIQRFEIVREAWRTLVVDRYIDRFVELVYAARDAGEIREVNIEFLGEMLRQIGFITRNDAVLSATGLTSEKAVIEIDRMVWDGIRRV